MICPYCQQYITEGASICSNCGQPVVATPVAYVDVSQPAVYPQQSVQPVFYQQPYPYAVYPYQQPGYMPPRYSEDNSWAWGLLGFVLPLVGLVVFIAWRHERPKNAKASGIGALASFLVNLAIFIVSFVVLLGSIGTYGY